MTYGDYSPPHFMEVDPRDNIECDVKRCRRKSVHLTELGYVENIGIFRAFLCSKHVSKYYNNKRLKFKERCFPL